MLHFNCACQFDISGKDSCEWLYIGTLLVDGFCCNHLSGPAADDGQLINSRAVFMCPLIIIMSKILSLFFSLFSGYEVKVFINTDWTFFTC